MASVILKNDAKVSPDHLAKVLKAVSLPKGRLLVVCSGAPLGRDRLGACQPRNLIKYDRSVVAFRQYHQEVWDCAVAYSGKTCSMEQLSPAYYTYLIAHELGHAKICMTEPFLHIHSCLVQNYITEASDSKVCRWEQMPHEIRIDQFAIYVTSLLFSRDDLNREIVNLISKGSPDHVRLKMLLELAPCEHFEGLRDELIQCTMPFKQKLIEIMRRESERSTEDQPSLAELVPDPELLFTEIAEK